LAENELITYWRDRANEEHLNNLCQNIRLALLLLGLCFASNRNSDEIKEISEELQNRFIDHDKLWGDTSKPPTQKLRQSEFSSALVVISAFTAMSLFKGHDTVFDGLPIKITHAANALQKLYVDDRKRERPYLPVLLIAVILVLGKTADANIRRSLSQYVSKTGSIFQRFWYHLDFVVNNNAYKRDYFIVPPRLLVPLLLLQSRISGLHYLAANGVLTEIQKVLDSNETQLFREPAERASSLEQALTVLALIAAGNTQKQKRISLLIPWAWIQAKKHRNPEWLFSWVLIVFAYIPLCIVLSAEWLIGTEYADLWVGERPLLEFAKHIPSWLATSIALMFTALREPKILIAAAIGKDDKQ
jgi:hypothetical protein